MFEYLCIKVREQKNCIRQQVDYIFVASTIVNPNENQMCRAIIILNFLWNLPLHHLQKKFKKKQKQNQTAYVYYIQILGSKLLATYVLQPKKTD